MAWLELHQPLARHPKLARLASRLGIRRPQALGHLALLWLWAMDYAPSGDLSALEPAEIAAGAEFDGDPEDFVEALKGARLLDGDGHIHDWGDYAGRLYEIREGNRERKRRSREKRRASRGEVTPGHMAVTRDGAVTGHKVTPLQDTTGQDRTGQGDSADAGTSSTAGAKPAGRADAPTPPESGTAPPRVNRSTGTNGGLAPTELILRQDELRRVEKELTKIADSCESHEELSTKDRERLSILKTRRGQLKTILGFTA